MEFLRKNSAGCLSEPARELETSISENHLNFRVIAQAAGVSRWKVISVEMKITRRGARSPQDKISFIRPVSVALVTRATVGERSV